MKNNSNYFQEIARVLKISNKSDKSYFLLIILRSIAVSSFPFVGIIYGALILDGFIQELSQTQIMQYVYQMVIIGGAILIARTALEFICEQKSNLISYRLHNQISKKTLELDFQQLESRAIKEKLSRADQGANSNGGIGAFVNNIGRGIENIISMIYSLVLVTQIFVIVDIQNPNTLTKIFNNPLVGVGLIIIILISLLFNFRFLNKINKLQYDIFEKNVYSNRIFGYLINVALDYKLGKDMRIYKINKLISKKQDYFSNRFINTFYCLGKDIGKWMANIGLLNHIVIYGAYSIIGIKAILGLISVGSVLRIVGAITAFNTAITAFIRNISSTSIQTKYLTLYEEYLNTDTEMYKGSLPIEKRNDSDYELEFKNVYFHYPNSEEMILKNVSLKMVINSKLAIVGPNGAGKTTFIKLLCRLYDPTEGEILLNGIDIKKYDFQEYIELISVVFQDFRLFSTTIRENVTCGLNDNPEVVREYLFQSGLEDRINQLDDDIDTYIYTNFGEKGLEISGGEAQKIAITRALYKDTPLVILDEPTSALDPISEYEIYTKFDNLVNNKTSIYISHRMASCRFCDNIIVFNEGQIIQMGSHDELLLDTCGLYSTMWSAQAKYYNA